MDGKTNVTFSRATTQRASEVIYEQIYQKIANGELRSGDRLPSERELAEQFGRSRPCIREALRMLQQDGLIEVSVGTNGGATVLGISLGLAKLPLEKLLRSGVISLAELLEYQTFIDHSCFMLALTHHTSEDAARLQEVIERFEETIPDYDLYVKTYLEYHATIAHASHNKLCSLISDSVTSLCASIFWERVTSHFSESEREAINRAQFTYHKNVVDAILARDRIALSEAVERGTDQYYQTIHVVL